MSRRLEGKVALITGASSGIGEAIAMAFAPEGAALGLAARRADRLEDLANRVVGAGGRSLTLAMDTIEESQVSAAVARTVAEFGRLDLLVVNAGVSFYGALSETTADESRRMIETNVLGVVYTVAAALPHMKAANAGHIVIMSSGAGRYLYDAPVYVASKHATTAFAETLRREVGRSPIRVTCIEPGAVATELFAQMRPEVRAKVEGGLADIEMLTAADIADAVLYAVTRPPRVNVSFMTVYPIGQS